jgi:tyrosinase
MINCRITRSQVHYSFTKHVGIGLTLKKGIHGRPYEPWDGVSSAPGIDDPGYCAHISNIFLPWHRPYLALYEQILFGHIIDAVNEFPAGAIRQRYASAALTWRMPYWDWAVDPGAGLSVYPDILTSKTVQVSFPNGTRTIDNPLYSYKFHPVSSEDMFFAPVCGTTGKLFVPS